MTEPMTPFAAMLFETARACQGRSAVVLHDVLAAKVKAWAVEQDAATFHYAPPAAVPFEEHSL